MTLPRVVSNRIWPLIRQSMDNLSLYCSAPCSFSHETIRKCVFNGIMWAAPHSLASWLSMTLDAELGLSLLPGSPLTSPELLELSFEDLINYGLWHPLENPDYTFTSHSEAALENSESKLKSSDTLKQWLSTFVILRPFNTDPTRWSGLREENALSFDKQLTNVHLLFPPKKGQEVLVRGLSPCGSSYAHPQTTQGAGSSLDNTVRGSSNTAAPVNSSPSYFRPHAHPGGKGTSWLQKHQGPASYGWEHKGGLGAGTCSWWLKPQYKPKGCGVVGEFPALGGVIILSLESGNDSHLNCYWSLCMCDQASPFLLRISVFLPSYVENEHVHSEVTSQVCQWAHWRIYAPYPVMSFVSPNCALEGWNDNN